MAFPCDAGGILILSTNSVANSTEVWAISFGTLNANSRWSNPPTLFCMHDLAFGTFHRLCRQASSRVFSASICSIPSREPAGGRLRSSPSSRSAQARGPDTPGWPSILGLACWPPGSVHFNAFRLAPSCLPPARAPRSAQAALSLPFLGHSQPSNRSVLWSSADSNGRSLSSARCAAGTAGGRLRWGIVRMHMA
jgi:hypothetical protein